MDPLIGETDVVVNDGREQLSRRFCFQCESGVRASNGRIFGCVCVCVFYLYAKKDERSHATPAV